MEGKGRKSNHILSLKGHLQKSRDSLKSLEDIVMFRRRKKFCSHKYAEQQNTGEQKERKEGVDKRLI